MSDNDPVDDVEPVDFDAELNDFAIGEDYAPSIPPPPSNTPRVKRRVLINEDNNTQHEYPAVGKKKNSLPVAVRNMNNYKPIAPNDDPELNTLPPASAGPTQPGTEAFDAERTEKQVIITQITELKKKLFVEGSGMRPTVFNTMEQLVAERDLCNTQINSRRGSGIMAAALVRVSGFIENIITAVASKEQLDVSSHYHLKDEVKECSGMFEEALTQISILHAGFFAVSPYADVAQCMAVCVESTNRKNQKVREFEKSPTASAPNTPVSNATSSQDDDNEVVDVRQ